MAEKPNSSIETTNPLVLAWVGDAYFSYRVRFFLTNKYDLKSGALHIKSKSYVSAEAQSKLYDKLLPVLTAQEQETARRARNAHSKNTAKNAGIEDYKKSSALEAVIGALVLTNDFERLDELFNLILST